MWLDVLQDARCSRRSRQRAAEGQEPGKGEGHHKDVQVGQERRNYTSGRARRRPGESSAEQK